MYGSIVATGMFYVASYFQGSSESSLIFILYFISLSNPPQSFAAGCKRCFISEFGYSTFCNESGRCRSQAHFSANPGSSSPSSICVTYLPSTGKNL